MGRRPEPVSGRHKKREPRDAALRFFMIHLSFFVFPFNGAYAPLRDYSSAGASGAAAGSVAGAFRIRMNSSPVIVSCFSRNAASS